VTDAVRAVATLDDPQRARLYRVARDADGPITREEAAERVGISRKLAAFHLDRLVDAGLLEVTYDRPPGAAARIGRAPKRYRASTIDLEVTIPERRYDLVGEILLDAVAGAAPGETAADAVARVAHDRGRELGAAARDDRKLGRLGPERAATVLVDLLADLGFEPTGSGERIVQRNCPFHRLAQRSPTLVCGINQRFVDGLLDGLQARRLRADLDPADGRCCVVITRT
jgi:predicted ArsR family transcriptional regulator